MTEFSQMVLVGRVVRPQGRRGEVVVLPLTDREERFAAPGRAFVAGPDGRAREMRVTASWPHKGRVVLKLEGVDSIDDAERLRGCELRVEEADLPTLPHGSYYHHQLAGLRVFDEGGDALGVVESVMETGGEARVLVVRGPEGEMLVPFASSFVRAVDLEATRIVIVRPEYVVAD
jgi:16S rRNA processing protein RimM